MKQARVLCVLFLFSVGFAPLCAFTPKKGKNGKKKAAHSAVTTKNVQLVQSSDNVELTTNEGHVVALPKVNKILKDDGSIVPQQNTFIADAGFSHSLDALQRTLLERKEMEELSERLQIKITDASLLDFYREAADWLGTRYRRGGMSRKAVDCSGFTGIIYQTVFGQKLDRVSTVIAKNVKESVEKEDLMPGDMVFFSTFKKKYINHVGVYLGEGKFIHASIKQGVIVSRLDEGYYSKTWRKGGRI